MARVIRCPFCEYKTNRPDALEDHLEKKHLDMIPPDMEPAQYVYFIRTGRNHGSCVICHRDTKWNKKTGKYHRFCDDPRCKQKYIEVFRKRMIGAYGKVNLLDDPKQQRKMLENRKISGVYHYEYEKPDGKIIRKDFHYVGSYEKDFLEFLDVIMDWDPDDIFMPSPHTYYYMYEGKKHFYIPDIFIASLGVEIEIKDGGDNPNMHGKIQAVDKVKETAKDRVLSTTKQFDYLKITNKNRQMFLEYLTEKKARFFDNNNDPVIMIGK